MAYLISDKRHGNEVYVTKAALNVAFFFFSLPAGMTDFPSPSLLTIAVFSVIWSVFLAIIYFQCCWVWSSSPRKGEEIEGAGGGGLQRLSQRGWAFAAFTGKLCVQAGETGANHGLVAGFCVAPSSAGHLRTSRARAAR